MMQGREHPAHHILSSDFHEKKGGFQVYFVPRSPSTGDEFITLEVLIAEGKLLRATAAAVGSCLFFGYHGSCQGREEDSSPLMTLLNFGHTN